MSKNEYRSFFAYVCKFLKMARFLSVAGISPVNFSRFMKGPDWNYEIFLEKLDNLYSVSKEFCENIA